MDTPQYWKEVKGVPAGDYLLLLKADVEELVGSHLELTGRLPKVLLMPKSIYLILEDYCVARECEIYMELVLRQSQVQGDLRRRAEDKVRIARDRMNQLAITGIRQFSCKYGDIPIVVKPELRQLKVE